MRIKLYYKAQPNCYDGVCDLLVSPTKEFNLNQIPSGPNPRALDANATKICKIKESFLANDGKFVIKNGGMQVIVDDDSVVFNEEEGYVEFSCTREDWESVQLTGHYDGQHTQYAVSLAVEESNNDINNLVRITLIEKKCFSDIQEIRAAAESWNARTKQKITSEYNILGVFDRLKSKIDPAYIDNIAFKENQLNSLGEKIRPEAQAQQVLRLISTLFPLTYVDGIGVEDIASNAKGGESKAMKIIKDERYNPYSMAASEHVNFVIELSDFIQTNIKTVLGESLFDEFAMIKQISKRQLEKPVSKRNHYSQQIFTGESVSGALNKDWTPIFVYSLVRNCFEWDAASGEFLMIHNLESAKAIWLEGAPEVLKLINDLFVSKFVSDYRARCADFANQPQKWNQASDMIAKTIRKGDWRRRVQTTLKSAA